VAPVWLPGQGAASPHQTSAAAAVTPQPLQPVLLDPSLSLLLANAVLVIHVGIAAFVVAGLLLVIVGNLEHWEWVNNAWFRVAHAAAIGIVVAESWLGFVCPLTTFEMWLRSRAGAASYGGGFIEHWLQQLLYYSAPPWVFVAGYTVFALLVLATWWYFPPRFKGRVHEPVATKSPRSRADAHR